MCPRGCSGLLRVAFAILPILLLASTGLNSHQARSLHLNGSSPPRPSSATLLLPLLTLLGTQSAQAQQTTTLEASNITQTTATLTLSGHTQSWSYTPDDGTTCDAVASATTTAELTGLTAGTQYTYTAYSTTTCGPTSAELASKTFTTLSPLPKASISTLTGGDKKIFITWTNPTGISLQGNRIRYRAKGTSTWTYADANSDSGNQNFGGQVTTATIPANESFTMEDRTTYQVQLRHGKWNGGYSGWGEWSNTVEAETITSVCNRTTQVRDAIVAKVSGKSTCGSITATDLAEITTLSVTGHNSLTTLKASDFDGLTSLLSLELEHNQSLSSLPAGVFDELTSLTRLSLKHNSLASLPENVFDELTSLTSLYLNNNNLTCLPAIPISVMTLSLDKNRSTYAACGAGVTVNKSSLTVLPSGTATYTVVLDAEPNNAITSGNVTVTPASSATSKATVSPSLLTFTTTNWNTAQTVTVTGVATGTATISHTVAGGGYGGATAASVDVQVQGLTVSAITSTTATLTLYGHAGTWSYSPDPSGSNCTAVTSGTTANLKSLTADTQYTYYAFSTTGCGPTSVQIASGTPFRTLATVQGIGGNGANGNQPIMPSQAMGAQAQSLHQSLEVSWEPVPRASHYLVQWKSGNQHWDASNRQIRSTGTSVTITGLTNGITYTVRVIAINSSGKAVLSDTLTGTPVAATLTASEVEATTATLTIANYEDNWYYQSTVPTGGSCSPTAVEGSAVHLTDLLAGTSYTFAAYEDSKCSSLLATTPEFLTKPGQVSGVTVMGLEQSLKVTWEKVTGASSYLVQWKSNTQKYDEDNRQLTVTEGTSTRLMELDNGVTYTVRVAAVDATDRRGTWSAEVQGKTPYEKLPDDSRRFDSVLLPKVMQQVAGSHMRAISSRLESAASGSAP